MDECPVCCSPYLKPKLLPCLDTICFACLDEYVIKHEKEGTFSCPVCHTLLAIPQGGITLFDDNLHIKGRSSASLPFSTSVVFSLSSACAL